jgi:phytoene dehydrogenase-like protein
VRAQQAQYDAVVVGGGHNALVSAAYLARAGLSVLVLERLPRLGGAAVSAELFAGRPVRMSRYSYLVSLLSDRIIADLDLDVRLASRPTSSYTPYLRDGRHGGLLVERPEGEATRRSFAELTGGDEEYAAWRAFSDDTATLAAAVAPTLTEPLPTETAIREQVDPKVWRSLVEAPLGTTLKERFGDDLVRGVVATDGLIGCFASVHDPSLVSNKAFLHHVIGNGTGEWRVPVGGMGAVTLALMKAATDAGAEMLTGAGVSAIRAGDDGAEVTWHDEEGEHTLTARHVLAGVAPWVLSILLGDPEDPSAKPVGAQLKINMLLDRLPRLRSGLAPEIAFAGTFHVAQSLPELERGYAAALDGRLPDPLPGEVYCHSLTDPSILGPLAAGIHAMTYFGLMTPPSVFGGSSAEAKTRAVSAALAAIDEHLVEPLASCLARDERGDPCLEALTPQALEAQLAMPGGHIYHGDPDWPWAPNRAMLETPAQQWGVQTDVASVVLCGSGARRGGGVSGIPGHNAARAVLAMA